jgi:hypothetical protein
MTRRRGRWFLLLALLAAVVVWRLSPRSARPQTEELPLDDQDIPRLVAHLEEKGLPLRAVSTRKDGSFHLNAYLTTTASTWQDLNRLPKDPRQIELWRGTLYCERVGPYPRADLDRLWGDCYFAAGPFVFFGDRRLLEQIRAALSMP